MSSRISDISENVAAETATTPEQERERAEEFRRWWVETQDRQRKTHEENLTALAPKFTEAWVTMANLGVVSITVAFSGEGDSGQIDDVDLFCVAMSPTEHLGQSHLKNREAVAAVPAERRDHLKQLVESLSDSLLEDEDIPDWYNDDGGHGTLVWTLATKTIEVEVNQRVVEFETTTLTYDANGVEVD
jgi:hypothetical protein